MWFIGHELLFEIQVGSLIMRMGAISLLHEHNCKHLISTLSNSFPKCGPLSMNVHKDFIARAEYAKVSGTPTFVSQPALPERHFFAESSWLVELYLAN